MLTCSMSYMKPTRYEEAKRTSAARIVRVYSLPALRRSAIEVDRSTVLNKIFALDGLCPFHYLHLYRDYLAATLSLLSRSDQKIYRPSITCNPCNARDWIKCAKDTYPSAKVRDLKSQFTHSLLGRHRKQRVLHRTGVEKKGHPEGLGISFLYRQGSVVE